VYRRALDLRLAPDNEASLHNNIGNVLGNQLQRWGDALGSYREALEVDAEFAETHFNLAAVYQAAGRLDETAAHLRLARRLAPSAAKLEAREEELRAKQEKHEKREREDKWHGELDRRDGPLTRDQRLARFQQVTGTCGNDQACMRQMLGQTDGDDDLPIRF
jgi:tetratricopeptide (TPR) repeat protein